MKYRVSKLIYYETFQDIRAAISREKQIKAGKRVDKINLIKMTNPYWRDLFEEKTYEIAIPRLCSGQAILAMTTNPNWENRSG